MKMSCLPMSIPALGQQLKPYQYKNKIKKFTPTTLAFENWILSMIGMETTFPAYLKNNAIVTR